MIDDLLVGKTASFFALERQLSDREIQTLFSSIRASYTSAGNNILDTPKKYSATRLLPSASEFRAG